MSGRKLVWDVRFDSGETINRSGKVTGKGRRWIASGKGGRLYQILRVSGKPSLFIFLDAFFRRDLVHSSSYRTVADAKAAAQTREDGK